MKIRNGFVSNSSSSSFVVFGYKIKVDPNGVDDMKKILGKLDPEALSKLGEQLGERAIGDEERYIIDDMLHEAKNKKRDDFNIMSDPEDNALYIGYLIADVSSDDNQLAKTECGYEQLASKAAKAKELFGLEGEPKLYTGTRSC